VIRTIKLYVAAEMDETKIKPVSARRAAQGNIAGDHLFRLDQRITNMAKVATPSDRLPRGTKPVAQAFLEALEKIPQASRSAVAKAAQTLIRDELRADHEKQKAMRAASKSVTSTRKTSAARSRTRKSAIDGRSVRGGRASSWATEA
jgi:hypothetical protein